jgi:topoisomerase IA-like protein
MRNSKQRPPMSQTVTKANEDIIVVENDNIDDITIENVTNNDVLGKHEGKDIVLKSGKYGKYFVWNNKSFNYKQENLQLHEAINIILNKKRSIKKFEKDGKEFDIIGNERENIIILTINDKKAFINVPKEYNNNIENITLQDVIKIIRKNKMN